MNYSITPTPSYSYVCVAHCRSGERNTPAVTDQLSTIQPRTSCVLCTQIVYHSAPGLFLCRNAQPVHYPVPDFTCVTCSTVHGNLWHLQDPHRNPLTILIMCAVLPRNGFIWNTFTNTVACVFHNTPPGTIALFDATTSSCQGSRHHEPSSHRQRLAIASTPSSKLSDCIYEPHLAFQPRPIPILR